MLSGKLVVHEEPAKYSNTHYSSSGWMYGAMYDDDGTYHQENVLQQELDKEIGLAKTAGFVIGASVTRKNQSKLWKETGKVVGYAATLKDGYNYNYTDIQPIAVQWPPLGSSSKGYISHYAIKDLILEGEE